MGGGIDEMKRDIDQACPRAFVMILVCQEGVGLVMLACVWKREV